LSLAFWIYAICPLIAAAGSAALVRSAFRKSRVPAARGTEPGQGSSLVAGGAGASGGEGGTEHRVVLVPRDPQAYARAMAPRK
jgi:hypothetical protein